MFSGHWMESDLPIIQIDIPDPNITIDGNRITIFFISPFSMINL